MQNIENYKSYQNIVEGLAQNTIDLYDKYNDDYDQIDDVLMENLNSTQYMIYTKYHHQIIQFSDTKPHQVEWKIFTGDDATFADILKSVAFAILESDVRQKIKKMK